MIKPKQTSTLRTILERVRNPKKATNSSQRRESIRSSTILSLNLRKVKAKFCLLPHLLRDCSLKLSEIES